MDWKKIIIQTLVTVIVTVGTILIAVGRYQAIIEQHSQALYNVNLEHKVDIDAVRYTDQVPGRRPCPAFVWHER